MFWIDTYRFKVLQVQEAITLIGGRCMRAMENTQTLTNTSGAVDTEEALDMRGMQSGSGRKVARSEEGLTERALQGEDTTKTKTN